MRCEDCHTTFCQYRRTAGECVHNTAPFTTPDTNPFSPGPWWTWRDPNKAAEIVRKNAEPPVSREKFERRKKVWKAHEKAVLEPVQIITAPDTRPWEGVNRPGITVHPIAIISAAQDLVDAVERYVEPKPGQEFVHRSEILLKKNALKEFLK